MAKKADGLALVIGVGKPKGGGGPDDTGDDMSGEETLPPEEEESSEPAPEEEAEGAYPEFSIPEGLDLSDLEPGEEKEVLCVISKTSDTEACIKQVDGVELAGESQGMYGPPPAAPVPPPPPAGGMPAGGVPRGLPARMPMPPGGPPMPPGMPPPGIPIGPGAPVRRRAAAAGLM